MHRLITGAAIIALLGFVGGGCLSGCAVLPSRSIVELHEKTVDQDNMPYEFDLLYSVRGDAEQQQDVSYTGEGKTPWKLTVNQAGKMTSPAMAVLAQGWAEAIAKTPEAAEKIAALIVEILKVVNTPEVSAGNALGKLTVPILPKTVTPK